jgi:hypothetical protein
MPAEGGSPSLKVPKTLFERAASLRELARSAVEASSGPPVLFLSLSEICIYFRTGPAVTCSSARQLDSARRTRTSKKISGLRGHSIYCSMGLPAGHPSFLLKGGTSLSKAYGLISRFSEDIDITVFREDMGQAASVSELESLSRKKRQLKPESIKNTCREYIQNTIM